MGYPNIAFCVMYRNDVSNAKKIKWFKITNEITQIIAALNNPERDYSVKGFFSFYEAEVFLKEKLDFEDKFLFGIADGQPISLNKYYEK